MPHTHISKKKTVNNISTSGGLTQMVWHRECLSCHSDSKWMLFSIKYGHMNWGL